MKKSIKLLVISFLFVFNTANSQSWFGKKIKGNGNVVTEKRSTTEYDEIRLSGSFDVNLVVGKEGEIVVQAEENLLPYIKVEVEGNQLKIYQEKDVNLQSSRSKTILITVPFDKISAIALSGSGDVNSKNPIKTTYFVATLSGSGNINLEFDADSIETKLSGSGDIILKGTTNKLISKTSGSGDVSANKLNAKEVECGISGSGTINVFCTESLKARISGSGDIFYYGNPKISDTKVSGSGTIKARN
jgi:Putative auto-transporter adhesin, head GIN domain